MGKMCCAYGKKRKRCIEECKEYARLAETEGEEAAQAEVNRRRAAAQEQAEMREAARELKRVQRLKFGPVARKYPPRYLFPPEEQEEEPLGDVVYEDGTRFTFFSLDQYVNYVGTEALTGAMWGAGEDYERRGWQPEPRAELAREIHRRNHGAAVFLLSGDVRTSPQMSYAEASAVASEQRSWTYAEARRAAGMTVVTARVSTGGPAPRRQLDTAVPP